jgi:hypothetical protein
VAGAEAVMADLRSLDAANAVTSRLAASVVRPLRAPTERGLAGATPPKRRARSVAARAGIDPAQESSNDPEFRSAFSSYIEWGSRLAVENSRTDAHPPQHMPMPSWGWNTAAGPPGSRVSALAPASEPAGSVALQVAGEPISFEKHIRPRFRLQDRASMQFAFDLWSRDDLSVHADAILARLRSGRCRVTAVGRPIG